MTKFYFTDTIYLHDDKLYYEENDIIKAVKKHNWHKILNEYGWEKLNPKWIKKLNSLSEHIYNNALYGALDCGGDGDCLFHCLSQALKSKNYLNLDVECEVCDLRKLVCDNIDYDKYLEIISIYKILKDSDDFDEDWDPYEIDFDEFKEMLLEGGNKYWGDNIVLNILKEKLDVNIIILNSNSIQNNYEYYPLLYDYDENLNTIILLYEDNIHFKLVGNFKDNNMLTYFDNNTIPNEILKLINYLR